MIVLPCVERILPQTCKFSATYFFSLKGFQKYQNLYILQILYYPLQSPPVTYVHLNLIKIKYKQKWKYSDTLATFEVRKSHMWLMAAHQMIQNISGIKESSMGKHCFILLVCYGVVFSQKSKRLYFLGCSTDFPLNVSGLQTCILRIQVTLLIPEPFNVITVFWNK